MQRFYAIVSGEHATLPHAELEGILDVEALEWRLLARHSQLVVFEARGLDARRVTGRAGFVEEVGRLLVYTEAHRVVDAVKQLETLPGVYRVEARVLRGFAKGVVGGESRLKRAVIEALEARGWRLSPTRYDGVLRVIVDEGVAVVGVLESRLRVSSLRSRWPHVRPFYKPGALDPRMARLFVNLARVSRGSVYLDPFCGTGGFAIEALLSAGAREAICGDIDLDMALGAPLNLRHYAGCAGCHCLQWDAVRLPLRSGRIDSIATDTPYGRLTTTKGRSVSRIIEGFLWEAARLLKRGRWVAFAAPHWVDSVGLALEAGLRVHGVHFMRVHGSLTRVVVVARRV